MGWFDDALKGIAEGVDAVGGAMAAASEAVGGAAARAADAIGGAASGVADAVGGAAAGAADAIGGAVGAAAADVYSSFGGSVGIEQEGNVRLEDGTYALPESIVSEEESHQLDVLTERYDKLCQPGLVAMAGNAIGGVMPDFVKDAFGGASDAISEAELFKSAM